MELRCPKCNSENFTAGIIAVFSIDKTGKIKLAEEYYVRPDDILYIKCSDCGFIGSQKVFEHVESKRKKSK